MDFHSSDEPTKSLLRKLKAIEKEAISYEDNHGYDPNNNAKLELAHEAIFQLTFTKANPKEILQILRTSKANCLQTEQEAYEEAEAEIIEKVI